MKKLVVCIIVDVYFSMKDAYFSPVTLKGVPVIFFHNGRKKNLGMLLLLLVSTTSDTNPIPFTYFRRGFLLPYSCRLEIAGVQAAKGCGMF